METDFRVHALYYGSMLLKRSSKNLIAGRKKWSCNSGSLESRLTRQGALERAFPVRVAQWQAEVARSDAPCPSALIYGKCHK